MKFKILETGIALAAATAAITAHVLNHDGASEPQTDAHVGHSHVHENLPKHSSRTHFRMPRLPFAQWATLARTSVVGTITEVEHVLSANSVPHRVLRVDVTESITGRGDSTVLIRVPGGTVGDYQALAPQVPEFEVGESYLMLLDEMTGTGTYSLTTFRQTNFRLVDKWNAVPAHAPKNDHSQTVPLTNLRHEILENANR